jgi:hypothetical protein
MSDCKLCYVTSTPDRQCDNCGFVKHKNYPEYVSIFSRDYPAAIAEVLTYLSHNWCGPERAVVDIHGMYLFEDDAVGLYFIPAGHTMTNNNGRALKSSHWRERNVYPSTTPVQVPEDYEPESNTGYWAHKKTNGWMHPDPVRGSLPYHQAYTSDTWLARQFMLPYHQGYMPRSWMSRQLLSYPDFFEVDLVSRRITVQHEIVLPKVPEYCAKHALGDTGSDRHRYVFDIVGDICRDCTEKQRLDRTAKAKIGQALRYWGVA